jgi:hypothetical protein
MPTEMLTTLQAIIAALSAPEFSEISRVLGRFKTAMAELKAVERLMTPIKVDWAARCVTYSSS